VIDTGVPRAAIACDSAKATFLAGERAVDQEQQAFARKLRRPQGSSSAFLEQLFRQRPSCRLGLALSPSRVAWNESGGAHRVFKFPPRLRVTSPPGTIGLVASTKRKLTHEAPARRKLAREADMGSIDQLRWNADRTALEAVYERQSVIEARVDFLDAVQGVAPEAFIDLCEVAKDESAESQGPRLAKWQQRWGLTAEWCGYAAFHTANAYPEPPPFFIYPELCASRPFKPLPAPELPAFDPTRETWASYETRCRTLLVKYRRRSHAAAEPQNFESVQDRRSRDKHLSWLAAYHVCAHPSARSRRRPIGNGPRSTTGSQLPPS
jgi:hypothetical protein